MEDINTFVTIKYILLFLPAFQEEIISIVRYSNALLMIFYRVKQLFINGTGQFNDALTT